MTFKTPTVHFKYEPEKQGVVVRLFLCEVDGFLPRIEKFSKPFPQFSDVPADHWAAKATLELRQAGILDGYPDGRLVH